MTLLAIALAPVIFVGIAIMLFFVTLCEQRTFRVLCCCFRYEEAGYAKLLWILLYVFVQLPIMFGLWMTLAAIIIVLSVVPFYVGLVFIVLRLIGRWCLSSKKKVSSEDREKYLKAY